MSDPSAKTLRIIPKTPFSAEKIGYFGKIFSR
jgi:hypothetical protein